MEHLDYGVVGNGKSAALISSTGSVEWLCFPDFDSPSIFASLLDAKWGGSFKILVEEPCRITQQYIKHTNILSTLFETVDGAFEVIDFMPRYKIDEFTKHFLPPELYRLIRLKRGRPRFRVHYEPRLNYGAESMEHRPGNTYLKSVSTVNNRNTIYLYSNVGYDKIIYGEPITLTSDAFMLVSYHQKLIPIDQHRVFLEYERTKVYWMNWSNRSRKFTLFNEEIERSMLVLKLMSFHQTGAVLAAITTSLPETLGEVRNWDYRFCWLRDASMSIQTLLSLGHRGAASRFMDFIHSIIKSKDERFQIMYGIRGERVLTESILPHLSGFKGSKPVRIGNDAYRQKQNDALGYLMDVIYQYYLYFPGTLNEIEEMWEVVKNMVKTVMEEWQDPDNGIWEIRNETAHFVLSKVMSWVALDRACSIAQLLHEDQYAERWRAAADVIKAHIHTNGWKESLQSFSQTYENEELDASLLLMESYGFIHSTDERYVSTVKAVEKHLKNKGLLFRYRNRDDFGEPTSAFTICSFWLVRALYVTGRKEEALELFKELLGYANHLGLYSEDLDFETKEQLGNFPQAYSHLAMINTALLFSEDKALSRFIRP